MINGGASSGINHAFHLHVLGTPPAFVLSQDQTLILKSLKWLHFDYLRSLSQIYCLRIDFAFCLGFYTRTLLAKLCSVFKVLPPSGSTRRLLYFIKPSSSCQELFEFVFRHPLELFISCLTTFKYITSFFSPLQVLFSFYWFFLCSGFLFKLCRFSRSDFINLPYFCSSCKFAPSFALI